MKDMDLNYKLPMSKEKATKLYRQIAHDTAWLISHNVTDYSFYLGVHKRSFDGEYRPTHINFAHHQPAVLQANGRGDTDLGWPLLVLVDMSRDATFRMSTSNGLAASVHSYFCEDDGGIGAVFVEGT